MMTKVPPTDGFTRIAERRRVQTHVGQHLPIAFTSIKQMVPTASHGDVHPLSNDQRKIEFFGPRNQ